MSHEPLSFPTPVTADLDPDARPCLRLATAKAWFEDQLLLGHELTGRVAILDPVRSLLTEALDGSTAVGDLVDDVVASIDLSHSDGVRLLGSLLTQLEEAGFLEGPLPLGALPRRIDIAVPVDSCLGQRWGLGRATTLQIAGNEGFRVSSTIESVIEGVSHWLRDEVVLVDPDEEPMDTIHLRAVAGRTRRLQQIFDTLDMRWYVSRDLDVAIEAFHRTLEGRLGMSRGLRHVQGPSLWFGDRVLLVHPSLWDFVTREQSRKALEDRGISFTPSGLLRFAGDRLVLPEDRPGGRKPTVLTPVGLATPSRWGPAEHARQSMHLLRWWDGTGFRSMVTLLPRLPVLTLPTDPEGAAVEISRRLKGVTGVADDVSALAQLNLL